MALLGLKDAHPLWFLVGVLEAVAEPHYNVLAKRLVDTAFHNKRDLEIVTGFQWDDQQSAKGINQVVSNAVLQMGSSQKVGGQPFVYVRGACSNPWPVTPQSVLEFDLASRLRNTVDYGTTTEFLELMKSAQPYMSISLEDGKRIPVAAYITLKLIDLVYSEDLSLPSDSEIDNKFDYACDPANWAPEDRLAMKAIQDTITPNNIRDLDDLRLVAQKMDIFNYVNSLRGMRACFTLNNPQSPKQVLINHYLAMLFTLKLSGVTLADKLEDPVLKNLTQGLKESFWQTVKFVFVNAERPSSSNRSAIEGKNFLQALTIGMPAIVKDIPLYNLGL